jgi:putative DNA primase/helicase
MLIHQHQCINGQQTKTVTQNSDACYRKGWGEGIQWLNEIKNKTAPDDRSSLNHAYSLADHLYVRSCANDEAHPKGRLDCLRAVKLLKSNSNGDTKTFKYLYTTFKQISRNFIAGTIPQNDLESRIYKLSTQPYSPLKAISKNAVNTQQNHRNTKNTFVSNNLTTLSDTPPEIVAHDYLTSKQYQQTLTLRNWSETYWNWQDGKYIECTKENVKCDLVQYLQRRYSKIQSNCVTNVLLNVSAKCSVPSSISMPDWLDGYNDIARHWRIEDTFATRSEIIHLPSLVACKESYSIPASPKYFNAVATDYDFDCNAQEPARWLEFLNELFGNDIESIELLRQWFGYCLTNDTRQQKILLMIGPKRSGKGTIAAVLRAIVGDGNCCAPTLSGLATNFGLSPLIGKSLAIIGDARLSGRTDVAATTERLLSISGEDAVTIDRKHREPLTVQLKTRFMIISNELPKLSDASGALASRLLILKLTNSFYKQEDKSLRDALLHERQSILAWSIGGWNSLRESGRFIEPASSNDLQEQMDNVTSTIRHFVHECCEINANRSVELDRLYNVFRDWCAQNGFDRPMVKSVFSRDLYAAYTNLKSCKLTDKTTRNRLNVIKGISILP